MDPSEIPFDMDPSELLLDIEACKRQSEIEERYILSQFRERRKKIEEDYPFRSKRRYHKRDHLRDSNVHHELQADLVKHIWQKFRMFRG
ncbi:uncharacterized protein LOC106383560 isoform X2 [Brassica napus]|uniref:uncharacterized protein LOC106383560 isoform X2 n=1 Tax=Brassica napus TaxID=3708 RepID=UPI00207AE9FE|nr:uncharacterized protein LOC106383560 isoform X2 [Brassica napus]